MQVPAGKLVSFTMFILLVPSFVSSIDEDNNDNIKKVISHKLMFEITLHGFLLWASMGFLMPIGILAIRMSNGEECGRKLKILFYVHAVSQHFYFHVWQILSVLLATTGAIMSIKNFNNSFNNHHQRLGVALYGIIWLQALTGVLRPWRGCKGRTVWFFAHWLLGTTVCILGVISIYTGLGAYYDKTSKSTKLWTIAFTVEITVIVLIYLFQDKWVHIQNQGVPVRPSEEHGSIGNEKGEHY
ncbi:hypothetical protein ES319_D07G090600v1 [Gossypium barbadense]|uniref:Cytochrome b561 domain-containing protein n=2 Tax=Gossypium TaxID=3633 RepID=A0A5J5QP89_GOSBA|nr:hypothetical protein ES319_D07G090600v1 [Gossypium barbadense]TYG60786.1 hypothetical protein ES288_D07G095700v1 [Gossypium darwinii]